MNSKELFEEYTKEASNKMKWVSNKAKELGVSGSDVVFELLKSGFRLDELKRGNPTQYKSAQKKLDAWKKAGSPSDEDEDVLQRIKEENTESTQVEEDTKTGETVTDVDDILYSAEYVEKLERKISELTGESKELKQTLENTRKALTDDDIQINRLEDLNGKQAEQLVMLGDENTRLRERIRGLESEAEEAQNTVRNSDELEKLRADNETLVKTNRVIIQELDKFRAEKNRFMKRIDELQAELNETTENFNEAMMFNRKLEEQMQISEGDLKSEQEHLNSMYVENSILKQKLERAERYILDRIYSQMEE